MLVIKREDTFDDDLRLFKLLRTIDRMIIETMTKKRELSTDYVVRELGLFEPMGSKMFSKDAKVRRANIRKYREKMVMQLTRYINIMIYAVEDVEVCVNAKERADFLERLVAATRECVSYYESVLDQLDFSTVSHAQAEANLQEVGSDRGLDKTRNLADEAIGLNLTIEDALKVVGSINFNEFIKKRMFVVPYEVSESEAQEFYGVFPILDDSNLIKDVRVCIPTIKDLDSYLVAVELLSTARRIFDGFNCELDEKIEYVRDAYSARSKAEFVFVPKLRRKNMKV